jgi:citrate lyase beta subunit
VVAKGPDLLSDTGRLSRAGFNGVDTIAMIRDQPEAAAALGGADLYDTVQTSTGQNHANPLDFQGAAHFGVDRKWAGPPTKTVQIAPSAVFPTVFPNTVP